MSSHEIATGIKGSAPLVTSVGIPSTILGFVASAEHFLSAWIPIILGIVSIWAALETVRLHRIERRKITEVIQNERRKKADFNKLNACSSDVDDKRMQ